MDITLTVADLFLLGWAVIATIGYLKEQGEFKHFRMMTVLTLRKLHKGEVKLVDNGDSFEIKDVK
jgi:hypothetical protein